MDLTLYIRAGLNEKETTKTAKGLTKSNMSRLWQNLPNPYQLCMSLRPWKLLISRVGQHPSWEKNKADINPQDPVLQVCTEVLGFPIRAVSFALPPPWVHPKVTALWPHSHRTTRARLGVHCSSPSNEVGEWTHLFMRTWDSLHLKTIGQGTLRRYH